VTVDTPGMTPLTSSILASTLALAAGVIGVLRDLDVLPSWTLAVSALLIAAGFAFFFQARRGITR
jgi:hypothetical protein